MSQPLSRYVVQELKSLGVISGTRHAATEFFGAKNGSYLRSLWARKKDCSISSYLFAYAALLELYNDALEAHQKANTTPERLEIMNGAHAVKDLALQVWSHLMVLIEAKKQENMINNDL